MRGALACQRAFSHVLCSRNMQGARKHFQKSLEHDPTLTLSFIGYLGSLRHEDLNLQWDDLPFPVQKSQDTAVGRTIFARNLLLTKGCKPREALPHLERAIALDPNHHEAYLIKAGVMALFDASDKNLDQAVLVWKKGYDLAVKSKKASDLEPDYYLIMAAIESLRNKPDLAKFYITTVLDKDPHSADAKEALQLIGAK